MMVAKLNTVETRVSEGHLTSFAKDQMADLAVLRRREFEDRRQSHLAILFTVNLSFIFKFTDFSRRSFRLAGLASLIGMSATVFSYCVDGAFYLAPLGSAKIGINARCAVANHCNCPTESRKLLSFYEKLRA